MDSSIDSIISRARKIAALPGWSKTKLAREADLGINGLVDLPNDDFNPTTEKLRKLEAAVIRIESQLLNTVINTPEPPISNEFNGFHAVSDGGACANACSDINKNHNLTES